MPWDQPKNKKIKKKNAQTTTGKRTLRLFFLKKEHSSERISLNQFHIFDVPIMSYMTMLCCITCNTYIELHCSNIKCMTQHLLLKIIMVIFLNNMK